MLLFLELLKDGTTTTWSGNEGGGEQVQCDGGMFLLRNHNVFGASDSFVEVNRLQGKCFLKSEQWETL